MNDQTRGIVKQKPLQAGKFAAILLTLVLGFAGFFRIIDARGLVGNPVLGDGQFLALLLIPVLSMGLFLLVFAETLLAAYRVARTGTSLSEQIGGGWGYLLLRGAEAGTALVGVLLLAAAVPTLLAESTPAPAGVGLLLLLFVVGCGMFLASLVRSFAELTLYAESR